MHQYEALERRGTGSASSFDNVEVGDFESPEFYNVDQEEEGGERGALTQRWPPGFWTLVTFFLIYVVGHSDELGIDKVVGELLAAGWCP